MQKITFKLLVIVNYKNHSRFNRPRNVTDRERSSLKGNCRKCDTKSEKSLEAEHKQTDKRLSLNIISTHWFEKWSLALISGRAGVWDKVHLANLNLQNTQRSNETLCLNTRKSVNVTTERAGTTTKTKITGSERNQDGLV